MLVVIRKSLIRVVSSSQLHLGRMLGGQHFLKISEQLLSDIETVCDSPFFRGHEKVPVTISLGNEPFGVF